MTTSVDDIHARWQERRGLQSALIARMIEVRDAYNGDFVVPLPDLDMENGPAIANIVMTGIDQNAMRVASVEPVVEWPAVRPGFKQSEEKARQRQLATFGWWEKGKVGPKRRRRARHLIGYGSTPVRVGWDVKQGRPCWDVRDPLSAYPAPCADPDDLVPSDTIFTYVRSLAWLEGRYPDAMRTLRKGPKPQKTDRFEVLEYVDGEEIVLICLGKKTGSSNWDQSTSDGWAGMVELDRTPHRAGMPLVVVPTRINLDRPQGQMDQVLGMYRHAARLANLEIAAVEKSIFPQTFLVQHPASMQPPTFISGPHDGRTGKVNIVTGGVQTISPQPGFQTNPTVDRLEAGMRQVGGVPAEFGGESTSNIRTGRRGDAVMSEAVDFRIQEAQEQLAASAVEEARIARALVLAYAPNRPQSFFIDLKGKPAKVDYTPADIFRETDHVTVRYPRPGMDTNTMATELLSLAGAEIISKRTVRHSHPAVNDPVEEERWIELEGLRRATLTAIEQQAASGDLAAVDMARITALVVGEGMDLHDAVAKANEEAQKRQASQGPVADLAGPAMPGSPEAQPGLAAGAAGTAQPTIPQPAGGLENLKFLLGAVRSGARGA